MNRADGALDVARRRRSLYVIIALCTTVALFDGYDGAAAAFSGPALLRALHLDAKTLGVVFSSSLVGMAIGAGLFGVLADRAGRRPAIILSIAVFGVFTLLAGLSNDFASLVTYRMLTGLGLGGALSNAVAVSAEFAPQRLRATVVSIVYSAFPLGSVLGGYLAVWLIKDFGWRSIFLVCAAATVPLMAAVLWLFPESIKFLRAKGASPARIQAALERLGMTDIPEDLEPTPSRAAPLKTLFVDGMWRRSLLLWTAFFANQLVVYFLFLWMPVALKAYGLGAQTGIVASATQSLGGVIGAFCLARLIDQRGPARVLVPAYAAALVLVAAVGVAASTSPWALILTVGCCGFMLNGANVNLASVAAALYPTSARSTGMGWAMGVGKAGGIAGSMIGGVLLQSHLSLPLLYALAGTPLVLAAVGVWHVGCQTAPGEEPVAAAT